MTGEEILKKKEPGDLFPNNEQGCRKVYKQLARKFHPDANTSKKAQEVFEHLTKLYNQALNYIKKGTWFKSNYIELPAENGKKLEINYLYHQVFEIGEMYVCKTVIVYVLNKGCDKYMDNAVKAINKLRFEDGKMQEIRNFVPQIRAQHKLKDERNCLVISKGADFYPLRTVLDYYDGKIPDKHVAWIVNRLSNLACFLQYSGLVHNGINVDNVFINPSKHGAAIYGGWWYTVETETKMIGTTTDIFGVMPVPIKNSKMADIQTDLESIKLVGRELLGEKQPRKLALDRTIPKQIIQFLNDGAGSCAYEEFKKYQVLLDSAYGKRTFIQMDITDKDVYKE